MKQESRGASFSFSDLFIFVVLGGIGFLGWAGSTIWEWGQREPMTEQELDAAVEELIRRVEWQAVFRNDLLDVLVIVGGLGVGVFVL